LQYSASTTVRGSAHREQNRGFSDSSDVERKLGIAKPQRLAVSEVCLRYTISPHKGAVLAAQITQAELSIGGGEFGVVAGD
jgi:hypothetical protein